MVMKRQILLQNIINKIKVENYLEIGTFQGDSLLPLECKNKIAVDPKFQISRKKKLSWLLKNTCNINNLYFEMTSDSFFREKNDYLKSKKFGLIFIDGLHTYKASLKDVLNSLKFLSRDGYIVMHDCYPPHEAASTPAQSAYEARMAYKGDWPGDWCGDVWKTIVYLKKAYKDKLKISVIDTDYGLGVISMQKDNLNLDVDAHIFESVKTLKYEDLIKNPHEIINLLGVNQFDEIFSKT